MKTARFRLGENQTISQPYIVALMIEAAQIKPGERVLEVGTGSGYAAAVMSRIAYRVYTIERHASLGESARERFRKLCYENIELLIGDGTLGWPEAAPFDAILEAAGGPEVPPPLKQQVAIGGRLIIPVGEQERQQTLLKVTRRSETDFEEEDLGGVMFVPLVGKQGWAEGGRRSASNHVPGHSRGRSVAEMIAEAAEPLPDFEDPAFRFGHFADRWVVLLGEASHGTSEFYRARAAITRHLIEFTRVYNPCSRSRLARCGGSRSLRARSTCPILATSRPFSASRPGCGAIPISPPLSTGCAITTNAWGKHSAAPAFMGLIFTI